MRLSTSSCSAIRSLSPSLIGIGIDVDRIALTLSCWFEKLYMYDVDTQFSSSEVPMEKMKVF